MYLKSARLKNWGCHEDLFVEFRDDINVCVGRNGAGKSTLYHAIVAALTVKHSSKQAELSRFQSWGREGFGPTASIDIVRDDGTWNLEKTYLHGPRCLLKRAPGCATPQSFNGPKAEQELDRWLENDGAAGRLILTLWSRQDAPIEYQEIPGAKSSSLGTLLDKAIAKAAQPETAGPFGVLKKKFSDEYDARFTRELKKIKTGSELDDAMLRRDEARDLRDGLLLKRSGLAEKVEELRVRASRHDDDCRNRDEFRRVRAEREALGLEYRARAAALKQAEDRAAALRCEYVSFQRDHERVSHAESELTASEEKLHGFAITLTRAVACRDQTEEAMGVARQRSEAARPLLDELGNAFERKRRVTEAAEDLAVRRAAEAAARVNFERAREALGQAEASLGEARVASEHASRTLHAALQSRLRRVLLSAERAHQSAEAEHRRALAAELAARRKALRERLAKVRALSTELAKMGADATPFPSPKVRAALAAEYQALLNLEGLIEADALTARLVAEVPLKARFSGDGLAAGLHELVAGESVEVRGVSGFSITVEGLGRVEIGRSSSAPAERLEQLRSGREALASRLAVWGVADVAGLDGRLRRAEERRNTLEKMSLLLDGQPVEEMEAALAALDAELHGLGVDPGDSPPAMPPGPGLKDLERRKNAAYLAMSEARSACGPDTGCESDGATEVVGDPANLRRDDEAARKAVDDAEKQSQRSEVDQAKAETSLAGATELRAEAEDRLADETSGDPPDRSLSDLRSKIGRTRADLESVGCPHRGAETRGSVQLIRDQLDEAIRLARAGHERARDRWAEGDTDRRLTAQARDQQAATLEQLRRTTDLGPDPGPRRVRLIEREDQAIQAEAEARLLRDALPHDPEADGGSFEGRAAEADDRCHQGDIALEGLRREISVSGADGLDSQVSLAEERLERCEGRVARLSRDASAWALLHHLLAEVEAEQSRNVAARLQALAAPRVSALTAGTVGEAIFDPRNLAPASARVPGVALNPGLDQFSRGTREQVALACRLQIGLLLSEGRFRHVLLLDDPLAHTDRDRHEAALAMLTSLSETLQLIIFTCHEDRYRSLDNSAKFLLIG